MLMLCRWIGISMCHKLVEDRAAESKLLIDLITEIQFADAAALYATSEENFVTVAQSFMNVASGYGLTVSLASQN